MSLTSKFMPPFKLSHQNNRVYNFSTKRRKVSAGKTCVLFNEKHWSFIDFFSSWYVVSLELFQTVTRRLRRVAMATMKLWDISVTKVTVWSEVQ